MDEFEFRRINYKTSADILNNAFDFLSTAATILSNFSGWMKHLGEAEAKASLISVTTSVELILKAKVASIDWREIFVKPNKAEISQLKSGDFKSVSFEDCIIRVESLTGGKLPLQLADNIEDVRRIRNQLIHFHIKLNDEMYATIISKGITVFIEFYRQYIEDDFCEEKDRAQEWEKEILSVSEYINTKLETITPKLRNHERPKTYYLSYCSICDQDTLIIKDKVTVKCIFCDNEDNIEELAKFYSEDIELIKECKKCDTITIIAVRKLNQNEEQSWECIKCGDYTIRPQKWNLGENRSSENSTRTYT